MSTSVEFGIPKHAPAVNIPESFPVNTSILRLHWVIFKRTVITCAIDILNNKITLAPIFAGGEVKTQAGIIRRVFKTAMRKTFKSIKFHTTSPNCLTTTYECVQRHSRVVRIDKSGGF